MSFCHHTINVRCPNCKSIAERHVTLHDSHDALEIRHDALRKERDELLADMREFQRYASEVLARYDKLLHDMRHLLDLSMGHRDGFDKLCLKPVCYLCEIDKLRERWGAK